jgi:sortase A
MLFIPETQTYAKRRADLFRWTHRALLVIGVVALSYVAITLLYAKLYQQRVDNILEQQIRGEIQRPAALSISAGKGMKVREGDVLGRIVVPRLGIKVVILQGTTSKTLRLGAGHMVGTAMPGEEGNIGIAGHRDSWFRDMKDIRSGDQIEIETVTGQSRYQVDWIQIVAPKDIGILTLTKGSALTVVTCYPFHYIGAAPERFVVHARKL